MELIINSELLKKCGGGSSEYWFSYNNYSVINIRDLDTGNKPDDIGLTAYYVSIGLIPFITISNEEIIRAFVRKKASAKLKSIFDRISSDKFIEYFWKYYNAYPELESGLDEFASEYSRNKVAEWCEGNNVNYRFAD